MATLNSDKKYGFLQRENSIDSPRPQTHANPQRSPIFHKNDSKSPENGRSNLSLSKEPRMDHFVLKKKSGDFGESMDYSMQNSATSKPFSFIQ